MYSAAMRGMRIRRRVTLLIAATASRDRRPVTTHPGLRLSSRRPPRKRCGRRHLIVTRCRRSRRLDAAQLACVAVATVDDPGKTRSCPRRAGFRPATAADRSRFLLRSTCACGLARLMQAQVQALRRLIVAEAVPERAATGADGWPGADRRWSSPRGAGVLWDGYHPEMVENCQHNMTPRSQRRGSRESQQGGCTARRRRGSLIDQIERRPGTRVPT